MLNRLGIFFWNQFRLMARILLTGFMGCGKSAAGVHLAPLLKLPFCDLDEQVKAISGQSVPDIFRTHGEAAFRDLESSALQSLPEAIVCALGGGTVLRSANMAWIQANGRLIYLKVSPRELQSRLEKDAAKRPLLCGPDGQPLAGVALIARITDLLDQRAAVYEQAHYTVEVSDLNPLQTAEACVQILRSYPAG